MSRKSYLIAILSALASAQVLPTVHAQSSLPTVEAVPSETPAPKIAPTTASTEPAGIAEAIVKVLQDTKATNAETIKKQEAALATLDELIKAAEQIKIYGKRG